MVTRAAALGVFSRERGLSGKSTLYFTDPDDKPDRLGTKEGEKLLDQGDALMGVAVTGMLQVLPQQGDGGVSHDDGQDEQVDIFFPVFPVGAIYCQYPWFWDGQECGEEWCEAQVGVVQVSPEALLVGGGLSLSGHGVGDFAEVCFLAGE